MGVGRLILGSQVLDFIAMPAATSCRSRAFGCMPTPLTFTIAHALGKAEAKARITAKFSELSASASGFTFTSDTGAWRGDVFALSAVGYGQSITGRIEAFDTALSVTIDVPSFLTPLARAAMTLMRNKTRLLLE